MPCRWRWHGQLEPADICENPCTSRVRSYSSGCSIVPTENCPVTRPPELENCPGLTPPPFEGWPGKGCAKTLAGGTLTQSVLLASSSCPLASESRSNAMTIHPWLQLPTRTHKQNWHHTHTTLLVGRGAIIRRHFKFAIFALNVAEKI